MKSHEKFLIATGFAAFILSIVFAVITFISFVIAIKNNVDGTAFKQTVESGVERIREQAENFDFGIVGDSSYQ